MASQLHKQSNPDGKEEYFKEEDLLVYEKELSSESNGACGNSAQSSENANYFSKSFRKMRNTVRNKMKRSSTCDSPLNVTPKPLCCYGVKGDNNPVYGNSACFIIANFTEDLIGYQRDVTDIVKFHRKRLKCAKIYEGKLGKLSMRDLTKEKFMKVLQAIQDYLKNPKLGGNVDRFFLYILSHGDKDGIKMCQEGSCSEEQGEDVNGKPIRVQMQDIVDMFTHDQVPTLKTFPKVFINQSCQGTEVLRAAGLPHMNPPSTLREPWQPPQFKLAVGADVIICDATSHNSMAWVPEKGSLFIQTLLMEMSDYLYNEAFYDILVEVNDKIACQMNKGRDPNTNAIVRAVQMPKIHSQLTKKFYLACPNQKPKFY